MTNLTPRELVNVLVDVDANGIVATFDLGDPFPAEPVAEWFIYGIALVGESGALVKHFAVRFDHTKAVAYIADFASATQANYTRDTSTTRGLLLSSGSRTRPSAPTSSRASPGSAPSTAKTSQSTSPCSS